MRFTRNGRRFGFDGDAKAPVLCVTVKPQARIKRATLTGERPACASPGAGRP